MAAQRTLSNLTVVQPRRSATMHLVQSSAFARRLANLLLVLMIVSTFGLIFLPWQQTSRGSGQVIAYVPQERQQTIQSPVKGVVAEVAPGLVEGSVVKRGDFILDIQPIAANLVEQLELQKRDLENKLNTANIKAQAYQDQVIGFTEALDFAVESARELVLSAKAKLSSKQQLVVGYEAKVLQTGLNYDRQNKLFLEGLKPQKEIEKLKQEWDSARADLESVQQEVASLKNEVGSKENDLEEKRRLAQTKIDYARAMEQDALGNAATTRKEQRDLEIKLAELGRLRITAPRDGTIFRMPIFERGQTIKEGESVLTIVPDSTQMAVELFIMGNDMPLLQLGQEVRLQFEGWPAVQFPGWPSVAVGTFSGSIANVDATDDGLGKFRVLVTPRDQEQAWPSDRYLRQGVRVNGWVILRKVTLGYEIWRQLNGFPVILSEKEPSEKTPKVPKLPK